jgi:hypothetical protein
MVGNYPLENTMTEHIVNWFVDTMARTETLDLYFVISDLIDLPESAIQRSESAFFDSMAIDTVNKIELNGRNIPIGKLVL